MKIWRTVLLLLTVAGCAPKDDWYESSSRMDDYRKSRVDAFKQQGMDQVKAEHTADFESYIRNTEIGHRKPDPVEGGDLKDAVNRPLE